MSPDMRMKPSKVTEIPLISTGGLEMGKSIRRRASEAEAR
jgi:hypothetical protein